MVLVTGVALDRALNRIGRARPAALSATDGNMSGVAHAFPGG